MVNNGVKSGQTASNAVKTFIMAVIAGFMIGVGGCFFLAIDNKVIGSLFFTLGLFTICSRGFNLFTGKVGYAIGKPLSYIKDLAVIWVGNLVGTGLTALLMSVTRNGAAFAEKAAGMCATKLNDSALSIFVLALFCNVLMYIAVDGFKTNNHEVGKYVGLFLCVAGFILAGFEHCIANMFYFSMAGAWSGHAIVWLIIMTAGNAVGGLLIPVFERYGKN